MNFRWLVGLVLLGLPLAPAWAECSKTLVVNQAAWQPYMYRTAEGDMAGLDYELVRHILELAGCGYHFVEYPSKRALVGIERGEIDLVAGASITPARQVYGRFTRSYREERMVLLTRREDRGRYPATSLAQFMSRYDVAIGAVNGGYYGEEFRDLDHSALQRSNRLFLASDNERLLRMLMLDRIDAVVGDVVSLHVTAESLAMADQISVHEHTLNADVVHFLLSKKSTTQSDLDAINTAIEAFVATDEYTALLERFGFEPSKVMGSWR
ncbi:substrate-binding periplasmic protein [Marinobacter sp. SS21]|uniref:substrate-binding periplasmic protein n=1 Tax=Marinobacter sp. SS21 TaxID=2979460 RepID=UPI00232ADED2|nr:transporter substrate-binding domain-containing protein [Marinobacter sp. SS21]MDC0663467.1 transporter substrate-binding domain-containing protein [Marinobacter sp. SS21]